MNLHDSLNKAKERYLRWVYDDLEELRRLLETIPKTRSVMPDLATLERIKTAGEAIYTNFNLHRAVADVEVNATIPAPAIPITKPSLKSYAMTLVELEPPVKPPPKKKRPILQKDYTHKPKGPRVEFYD